MRRTTAPFPEEHESPEYMMSSFTSFLLKLISILLAGLVVCSSLLLGVGLRAWSLALMLLGGGVFFSGVLYGIGTFFDKEG